MILQMLKGLFTAFGLSFMRFTLMELIYVLLGIIGQSGFPPRTRVFNNKIKYSMHHCQKSPDSFPLLSSSESTVIEVFLVSVVHVSLIS